jgi:hypothetical protein
MTQEIYVLAPERTRHWGGRFLSTFLPRRIPFAVDYPVPEYADSPTETFAKPDDLMGYLDTHPEEVYGIYWDSLDNDGPVRQAMLFYTSDRQMVFGLAVMQGDSERLFEELLHFSGTGIGFLGTEERPPDTAQEFVARAQLALPPSGN